MYMELVLFLFNSCIYASNECTRASAGTFTIEVNLERAVTGTHITRAPHRPTYLASGWVIDTIRSTLFIC